MLVGSQLGEARTIYIDSDQIYSIKQTGSGGLFRVSRFGGPVTRIDALQGGLGHGSSGSPLWLSRDGALMTEGSDLLPRKLRTGLKFSYAGEIVEASGVVALSAQTLGAVPGLYFLTDTSAPLQVANDIGNHLAVAGNYVVWWSVSAAGLFRTGPLPTSSTRRLAAEIGAKTFENPIAAQGTEVVWCDSERLFVTNVVDDLTRVLGKVPACRAIALRGGYAFVALVPPDRDAPSVVRVRLSDGATTPIVSPASGVRASVTAIALDDACLYLALWDSGVEGSGLLKMPSPTD